MPIIVKNQVVENIDSLKVKPLPTSELLQKRQARIAMRTKYKTRANAVIYDVIAGNNKKT